MEPLRFFCRVAGLGVVEPQPARQMRSYCMPLPQALRVPRHVARLSQCAWLTTVLIATSPAVADEGLGSASRPLTSVLPTRALQAPPASVADDRDHASDSHQAQSQAASGSIDKNNGLELEGAVAATWGASGVRMTVGRVANRRTGGTSGTLRLELWATAAAPVFGETIYHYALGAFTLGTLPGGFGFPNVDTGLVPYSPPPTGCYYLTVALLEFIGAQYFYQDLVTFTEGGVDDGTGLDRFSFGGASCSSTAACVRTSNYACLGNGRFEVWVGWATSSTNGYGSVMSFGGQRAESTDSVFYSFFNGTNFEIGLKVLNGCGVNNKFWVFIGGLTNQAWEVHVRDTLTGATKIYSNPLGHVTTTVTDTSALSCP